VRDAIEKLHGDLTMIIIGHRLPTLEHADQVIVLEAGRIVQQGSWQDIQNIVDHTK
jgi:ATP-binding cassette subfamily C protein